MVNRPVTADEPDDQSNPRAIWDAAGTVESPSAGQVGEPVARPSAGPLEESLEDPVEGSTEEPAEERSGP